MPASNIQRTRITSSSSSIIIIKLLRNAALCTAAS
jgi:hypothetical protein